METEHADWTIWLRHQRRRAMDSLLLIILIFGAFGVALSLWRFFNRPPSGVTNLPFYGSAYLIILITYLMRRWGETPRVLVVLMLMFSFSIWAFFAGWLSSSGRVLLLAMVALAGVLASVRISLIVAGLGLVSYAGMGLAYSLGWLQPRPLPDPTTPEPIIIEGLGFLIAMGIVAASQWYYSQALIGASQAAEAARRARQELDEHAQRLKLANQQAARRAEALALVAQVAQEINTLLESAELLPRLVSLISERFGFYAVSVYLLDNNRQAIILQATYSNTGDALLPEGYRLDLRGSGLIATAARCGEWQLINDIQRSGDFLPCEYLPATASELALPLRARGRVIGVLDIQCAERDRFSPDDVQVLALLADQVALAIDNALLFQELNRRRQQLELANEELESFSYSVSHDLRAPLRSIEGYSALLLDECCNQVSEECQGFLHSIRTAVRKMSDLIDGLLRLARLSRLEMQVEEVDLSRIATEEAAILQGNEPTERVHFEAFPNLKVMGDAALLRIVLHNLLENAWKFTRGQQERLVSFGVVEVGDEQRYFVRDNGVGFAQEYAERIFLPFQRLHRVEDYPGTGIGLTTVRRIVQRHGGRIWAESSPGAGTTIFFTLS